MVPVFRVGERVEAFDGPQAGKAGAVLDTLPNGKVLVDCGGEAVQVNPVCLRAAEPWFGIPDDLVPGDTFSALSAAPENWGMRACFIDALRAAGGDGGGEVVAVIDTGADPSHPEFPRERWHAEPWSDVPGEDYRDSNGHGTHCLGTAAGSSPAVGVQGKSKLLAGKCLSNAGSGSNGWIRSAFRRAVDLGATVVSMSIGGPGFMESMEDLFRQADAAGVVSVVAAGNERQQGGVVRFSPTALVVAAVDANGRYAAFSNPAGNGDILSVAAPGVGIVSARPGGGYQGMSGTSMATPFVAGVVAAVQSARVKAGLAKLRAGEFKKLFRNRAIDAGAPGPDRDYGPGLIDGNLLANSLRADPPEVK
jgi:subtilisin family serine protease